MKHEESTGGRSSMRGKCQRIFFNAWNLHGMTGAQTKTTLTAVDVSVTR